MDISLDMTIPFPYCIFILFAHFRLWQLVLAFITINWFWFGLTWRYPFNMVLASIEFIVYCHHPCRALAGQYAWRVLTSRDFTMLNDQAFCPPSMVMAYILDSRCQSSCLIVVRVAGVRVAGVRVAALRVAAVRVAAVRLAVARVAAVKVVAVWVAADRVAGVTVAALRVAVRLVGS